MMLVRRLGMLLVRLLPLACCTLFSSLDRASQTLIHSDLNLYISLSAITYLGAICLLIRDPRRLERRYGAIGRLLKPLS